MLCAGGLGVSAFLVHIHADDWKRIEAAADRFVEDLEAGDYAGAYARLCTSKQAQVSLESFTQYAKGRLGRITDHEINWKGKPREDVLMPDSVTVPIDLKHADGSVSRQYPLPMRNEDGEWRICRGDSPF